MPRLRTPASPFTCQAVDFAGPDVARDAATATAARRAVLAAPERVASLRGCDLATPGVGTAEPDATLDRLVRRAAASLGAPVALASRVDVDGDHWLATAGIPAGVAADPSRRARPSFCEEVVVTAGPVVVNDALADPHFATFPAVDRFGVRACLATPLVSPGGQVVGSFCVLDVRPRAWSADDLALLQDLAAAAVVVLERGAARSALYDLASGGLDATYLLRTVRDADGGVVDFTLRDCNARATEQLARPREALLGRRWGALFTTPRARQMFAEYARVAETGVPFEAEFAVTDPAVQAAWLRVRAVRVGDGVAVAAQDITARKAAEAALRESEARYRTLVESLPVVVYRAQPHPPYAPLYVSAGAAVYGYSVDEWMATPDLWVRILHPEDRERVLAETGAALEAGTAVAYEYRVVARDGAVRWVYDRGDFVRDADGRAVAWQGVMLDVTDRHGAEEAREAATRATAEREAHFRALIEHAEDVIGVIGADATILYQSPAITRVLGVAPDELAGRDPRRARAAARRGAGRDLRRP